MQRIPSGATLMELDTTSIATATVVTVVRVVRVVRVVSEKVMVKLVIRVPKARPGVSGVW